MAESTFKRQKVDEIDRNDTDIISTLPDSVLCHILSFLPTKTSVAKMSLVSRRWRHLWENLQDFDFYLRYYKHSVDCDNKFKNFATFVNNVLTIRRSRGIRKFHLSCGHPKVDQFLSNCMDTWIRAATGPNLEELNLTLFYANRDNDYTIFLNILSTCTNLVSLSLNGDLQLQLQRSSAICLHSLKKLQLDMGFVDMSSVDILLSGCPILESLELSLSPISFAILRVPSSLKRLKFTVENDVGACLMIDTPGLKYLSLTKITFNNAAAIGYNVEEAYIDIFPTPENESVDLLLNLLRSLSRIKHLVLSLSTLKWLFTAPVIDLPEFCYLLHLEVVLPYFSQNFMLHLLQKCPMLQALIIQNDKDQAQPHINGTVATTNSIPNCLMSHLIFIHFKGHKRHEHETKFAGYVLRNGLVLKTMLISGLSLDKQEKCVKHLIFKYFSNIPRGSVDCQLKFD